MSEENNQSGAAVAELRDVPADITEYKKFVAEGGNEHNDRILAREAAEKAARAAGIVLAPEDREKAKKRHFAKMRILQKDVEERDQRIAELERASAQPNGGSPPAKPDAVTPAAAADKTDAKPAAEDKTPPRPNEADFKTWAAYNEALIDWKTDRALEAVEAKRNEARRESEAEAAFKVVKAAHDVRVDEAKTRIDDFAEAFDGLPDNAYSPAMYQFIFESDKGPEISYYLAKHRKELARLCELSDLKQAAALGRIEDRFTETKEKTTGDDDEGETEGEDEKPAPAKPAKAAKAAAPADDEDDEDDEDEEKKPAARRSVQSRAPAPAKPLGGRGGADDAMPDPKNFVEYEKWSLRQQAKAKKR